MIHLPPFLSPVLALALALPSPTQDAPRTKVAPATLGSMWGVCNGSDEHPSGSLIRFDVESGVIERVLHIDGAPAEQQALDLVITPDGKSIIVAQLLAAGTRRHATVLQTLAVGSGEVQRTRRFDGWLDALEFHPRTGALWGMHCDDEGQRRIVRVDLKKGELDVVGALPGDLFPRSLAFTAKGIELWALSCTNDVATDELVQLDPRDAKVLKRLRWTDEKPAHALEITEQGRFVAMAWGGRVLELDPLTGTSKLVSILSDPYFGIVNGLEPPTATGAPAAR